MLHPGRKVTMLWIFSVFCLANFARGTVSTVDEADSKGSEVKVEREFNLVYVTDILKLSYSPEAPITLNFSIDTLANEVFTNFRDRMSGNSAVKVENNRKKGFIHVSPPDLILFKVESDPKIVAFLGFRGCLQITKLILPLLAFPDFSPNVTKLALHQFENFFEFVLTRTVPEYALENEKERNSYYLKYYSECLKSLPIEYIIRTNSQCLILILIERFQEWIPQSDFKRYYLSLKRFKSQEKLPLMRAVLPELVKSANLDTFSSPGQISSLYGQVRLGSVKNAFESTYLMYVEMMPVLRALMLLDDVESGVDYLRNFFLHFQLDDMTGTFFVALDHAIADTEFISKALQQMQRKKAFAILKAIFECIELDLYVSLKAAICLNLLNVSEALLLFLELNPQNQLEVLETCVLTLRNTSCLEPLVLVLAYCHDFDSQKMLAYASSLKLNELFKKINHNDFHEVLKYNNKASAVFVLIQAASFLNSLPIIKPDSMKRVAWHCPARVFDTSLSLYRLSKGKANENAYCQNITYNLVQMMLVRRLGISFFETRVNDAFDDAFDWREAMWIANFMIQKNCPKLDFCFFDPILENLDGRNYKDSKFKRLYYRAVKNLEYFKNEMLHK